MNRIRRWPARALGLDRNPLLRRCDRVEAAIMTLLVAAFLIAGPLLAIFAGRMADAADLREQHAERSWRQVSATVVGVADQGGWTSPGLKARWTAPDGHQRAGVVPVAGAAPASRHLAIWVDTAGRLTGPPVARWEVTRDVVLAAAGAPVGLAFLLFLAGGGVRLGADRRRIAAWERAWGAVGPRWSRMP